MLRLDRMLVTLGKGSRSEMQKAIRGGRVRVNGDVQRDPSAQVAEDAEILLNGEKLDNVLLAGGLSPDNCVEAAKTGCAGLDFNSGVESQPGSKDASKLASVFKTLRAY